MRRSVAFPPGRRNHAPNPEQSALFDFAPAPSAHLHYGGGRGVSRVATNARQLSGSQSASAPTGGAATLPQLQAVAAGTFTPPASDKGDVTRPELASIGDRRCTAQRIAAIGGAGYLAPDDLADFAQAEASIFALMCDSAWHTTEAITRASGGQGEALRRMRNLRNKASTTGGMLRYLHIEVRRAGEKRFSLYRMTWQDQPQRHNAGGKL